ncbi:DUF3306 domain-containing protein [Teichococcus aestuarii]|uniref:DUF3306 domain-containing protein n=1 Tax=Teichococcus aestuarii TaxID=568898 RepID=A0A2U1V7V2_9PROT|nr:DUF3306 domain-containing protein [Pseudoroseomonas aestuarii]PWC29989.1 hypothetical protein CR165_03735 [Pseudoroseomonas aestuarii]
MSGEGFLSRWSRRKRGVEPEAAPEPPAPGRAAPMPAAPSAVPPAAFPAVGPDPAAAADAFDPASLPPLESLGPESDFTAFLKPNVPALLRQAALRRMWSLDPGIRDFVGPADYAWDFNAADGVPGFSPELGGNLRKLLAQAIGAPPEPEEDEAAAEDAEAGAPQGSPAGEAAVAEGPMEGPVDGSLDGPLEGAPPLPSLASAPLTPLRLSPLPEAAPAVTAAGETAAGEAGPGETAPAEAALPARRRHGGAVPQ